ncbi:hypothetical protein X777_09809 [Ooceraea biroi]|uniref:Uncharacterized protein n=1 Tax=Ooceraea biroi TaxID=2015173 RepID=A0A026W640_OOCBI|nr:hypothetical protein X777_09809 [Ooceraea biroi]
MVSIATILPLIAESGVSWKQHQTEAQSGYYGGAPAKTYKKSQKLEELAAPKNASGPSAPHKLNITAWGIIAIILGIILLSTITYYVFMLYPYICKKDQTYDIIELTEYFEYFTLE